ncbi:ATP-dependent DNA helicase PIF2-like [Gordionus sp. m RMFG-2023]|uniref:ATP-dependent DNA helicase PIF2-like n=1 Tax=Gordionus sp. m RMFG-2023 TaxID=3053472 RepID=UPI0031FE12A0
MPIPLLSTQSPSATANIRCHLIREEISYDTDDMYNKYLANYNLFNRDQNIIYAKIMSLPSTPSHNLFFIDGPGGTGKSFLLNTILFNLRAQGKIAIAVASSGIASTLLHNGRTAHSRFNIPLSIHESSSCNIPYQSQIAELIRQSVIIIWDEISMTHKHIFEAVDRSFQDIMKLDKPFGGKIIIFGGDFRQILPVIKRGGRCDIVNSTLKRSYLWSHIVPLRLCINMRLLQFQEANDYFINNEYSKFLLRVSEGCETFDGSRDKIKIPQDCCIASNDIEDLIAFVYDIDKDNSSFNRTSFAQNAILTPKNVDVDSINIKLINKIPGDIITYISADETITEDEATFYPTEF